MKKIVASLALVTCFVACNDDPPIPPGFGVVALGATATDPHDVAQFEFRVIADGTGDCSTGTVVASSTVAINATTLLSDDMFVVAAGNYLVCAFPQQADSSPSAECAEASDTAVVTDGVTTTVGLTSNCTGGGNGAIDVVVSLEDFPIITDIDFAPSKYFQVCEEVTISATLDDPGGDGFNSIAWTVDSAPGGATPVLDAPDQVSTTFNTDVVGDYTLKLAVDDQLGGLQELTFPMKALDCGAKQPLWLAGATGGAASFDKVLDVAADGQESIAVGSFIGTIDFGAGALVQPAGSGAFVLRLDANGSAMWSVRFGSTGTSADRVAVDSSGNILVMGGSSNGIADFAGAACPAIASPSYVTKLDGGTGDCLWASELTATSVQFSDLGVASNGDVVLATGVGNDISVHRFAGATGAPVWTGAVAGSDAEYLYGLSISPVDDAIVLAGSTDSTSVGFPGGQNVAFVQDSSFEGFVAKLDAATGDMVWVKTAPGAGSTRARGVTILDNGNVVAGWYANGDADFGGGTVTPNRNAIVTYDAAGTLVATRLLADAAALGVSHMSMAVAPTGEVRVATPLNGTVDLGLGPITGGAATLVFSFQPSTGLVTWAVQGGPTVVSVCMLDVAPDGATLLGGTYNNVPFTMGSLSLIHWGNYDPFVAKIAP